MTRDINEIIPHASAVQKLNDNPFQFLEGPVWDAKRKMLFFTDPLDHKIISMNQQGRFEAIFTQSGYGNGMCLNAEGNLVFCKMDEGCLAQINPDSKTLNRLFAKGYNGRPFNATNDVICDQYGGYYVTDPFFTFGPKTQDIEATYYCDENGNVKRVAADSIKPNGLAFSPDHKKLYIDDTGSVNVWCYDVCRNGDLINKDLFCQIQRPDFTDGLAPVQYHGEADGIKVDLAGNLYITTVTGIQIFNNRGDYLGMIKMPGKESAANCVFGGPNLTTLYITARTTLFSIEVMIPGC